VGWKDPENNITTAGESLVGASPLVGESTSAAEVDKAISSSELVDTSSSIGDFAATGDTLGVTVFESCFAVLSDTAAVDLHLARSSSSGAAVTTPKHTAASYSRSRAAKATALVQKVSTALLQHTKSTTWHSIQAAG
jgi:hypothetical protein